MKKNALIKKQIKEAKINFNYFLIQIVNKIVRIVLIYALFLLINQVFDLLIINIITLILTLYTAYYIHYITNYYNYFLNDIKNTFEDEEFYYTINKNIIKDKVLRGEINYGK